MFVKDKGKPLMWRPKPRTPEQVKEIYGKSQEKAVQQARNTPTSNHQSIMEEELQTPGTVLSGAQGTAGTSVGSKRNAKS